MLRVDAEPDQDLNMDSASFAVTAGASFTLFAAVDVPAESAGNAYVAVIFIGATEVERHRLDLAPQPIGLGEATTSPTGAFIAGDLSLEPGAYQLRGDYPGDIDHWPVHTESIIRVE